MKLQPKNIVKFIRKPDPVILEIGANIGSDSKRFLEFFKDITLFCFEPDPRCIVKFKKLINDSRCTLIESAISDVDGKSVFYLSTGSKPGHKSVHINSSSLLKPKNHLVKHRWCTFNEECVVPTIRLDTWMKESGLTHIDFIWADIQGAEEKFIKGAYKTLRITDYLYTEFSNKELYEGQIKLEQIKRMLPYFGVQELFSSNILLKNEYDKWQKSFSNNSS